MLTKFESNESSFYVVCVVEKNPQQFDQTFQMQFEDVKKFYQRCQVGLCPVSFFFCVFLRVFFGEQSVRRRACILAVAWMTLQVYADYIVTNCSCKSDQHDLNLDFGEGTKGSDHMFVFHKRKCFLYEG